MPDHVTVNALRHSVQVWSAEATTALEAAARERAEAQALAAEIDAEVARLPREQCMFCDGEMIDTSALRSFTDALEQRQYYLPQGEVFARHCLHCGVAEASEPRDSAKWWTSDATDPHSTTFAAELFEHFPHVREVALEQGGGSRGWLINYAGTWYATRADKAMLRSLWHLPATRTR